MMTSGGTSNTSWNSLDGDGQASTTFPIQGLAQTSRVCDRCISKKVKCNQVRPSCSRCLEDGLTCSYSSVKKKPGPSKGFSKRPFDVAHSQDRTSSHSSKSPGDLADGGIGIPALSPVSHTLRDSGDNIHEHIPIPMAPFSLEPPCLSLYHPFIRLTSTEQHEL